MNSKNYIVLIGLMLSIKVLLAQQLPAVDENIPYLVTFSSQASVTWGDDDFNQIVFISIPENVKVPFFVRIFDPNVGGELDESKEGFNSSTEFTILGGANCFSSNDDENKDPVGNYKNGRVLFTKLFGQDGYDNQWYTMGPINPSEGQLEPDLGGRIFKIVIDGKGGDDGNLYKLFVSSSPADNIEMEGANLFTYEYSFRMHQKAGNISHIYPYVDNYTIAVKQFNFDLDHDAYVKIVTMSNPGIKVKSSGDGEWAISEHPVTEKEKNTCLDVQFIKNGNVGNNNMVFYITNQYGKMMPFHSVPIGAIPKRKIGIKPR